MSKNMHTLQTKLIENKLEKNSNNNKKLQISLLIVGCFDMKLNQVDYYSLKNLPSRTKPKIRLIYEINRFILQLKNIISEDLIDVQPNN